MKAKIPELVGKQQAAAILGVAPRTLDRWRNRKQGPAHIKQDGRVGYLTEELIRYLDSCEVVPGWTAETDQAVALAESVPRDTRAVVYFIATDDSKFIKIGTTFSADQVEYRLSALQSACPVKLRLVALVNGGTPVERKFHRIFDAYRVQREWFRLDPAIQRFLEHWNDRRRSA